MTILELQRQVYNEVKAKRATELTNLIFETGIDKVNSFDQLLERVEVDDGTGAVTLGVNSGTWVFKTSRTVERLLRAKKSKNKAQDAPKSQLESPCTVSTDTDAVLSNIPQEIFANLDEDTVVVISEINIDDDVPAATSDNILNMDIGPDLNTLVYSEEVVSGDQDAELRIGGPGGTETTNETTTNSNDVIMESEIPFIGETVTIDKTRNNPLFNVCDAEKMILALQTNPKTCKNG